MKPRLLVAPVLLSLIPVPAVAQWTHRYPKVQGYSHHVYLEGYELPTLNQGPTDPAPSPDGTRVAFSARGWIWTLDLATGIATRVTDGPAMDFRPQWSPDGTRLAFVRDDSRDTWVVVRELGSGRETEINTEAIELDPVWKADGELVYASAVEGALDLWARAMEGDGRAMEGDERLTARPGIEVKPSFSADGSVMVYLHKGGGDRIVARDMTTGAESELVTERITSQTRPAVSPDGQLVAYNWPTQDGYELRLLRIADPSTSVRLTTGARGLPLAPAWQGAGGAGAAGAAARHWIWYVEADADEIMRLWKVPAAGGTPREVKILGWDWGAETGRVRIVTARRDRMGQNGTGRDRAGQGGTGREEVVATRLGVVTGGGHPLIPDVGQPRFDGQNGRVFFYSPGVTELTVPAGEVRVSAVQGLATPEVTETVRVRAGGTRTVTVTLEPVWDAHAAGYISGDHHFHLNYGGPYTLDPEDLLPMMAGEGLDVATPLLANLHNRFEDQHLWGWEQDGQLPLIQFGQEVRSHFLGHVAILGASDLFWPWIWGPGYQVYGTDDRPNTEALHFARSQGALGGYVHPVFVAPPFTGEGMQGLSVMLAVDGVLGNLDWLEVACLWSDETWTAEMWYRFLNLGHPVALEAGTDVMNDFYRTMAIGTTRLYVKTDGAHTFDAYWRGMKEGRSFVTTGPMLELAVNDAEPGGVIRGERARVRLRLESAVPVETVEILVNGQVVWSDDGVTAPGGRGYTTTVDLPGGGWVAARARGGVVGWPAMDSYAFAHTSPVWINEVGSTEPAARAHAMAELQAAIDAAEQRLTAAYGAEGASRIREVFERARRQASGTRR